MGQRWKNPYHLIPFYLPFIHLLLLLLLPTPLYLSLSFCLYELSLFSTTNAHLHSLPKISTTHFLKRAPRLVFFSLPLLWYVVITPLALQSQLLQRCELFFFFVRACLLFWGFLGSNSYPPDRLFSSNVESLTLFHFVDGVWLIK